MFDAEVFDAWNTVKKRLEKWSRSKFFKQGQVWWCNIGRNIGVEIYGKGAEFIRPVLIYKKLSEQLFLGVPLSTRPKKGNWFVSFVFNGKNITATLHQVRVLDRGRLERRIGELTDADFNLISDGFRKLYCMGKYSSRLATGL